MREFAGERLVLNEATVDLPIRGTPAECRAGLPSGSIRVHGANRVLDGTESRSSLVQGASEPLLGRSPAEWNAHRVTVREVEGA